MFNFRSRKSDTSYGVLIDISSGSIGAAIVSSHSADASPVIHFTERSTMRITKKASSVEENLRRVREALFSVALSVSQNGLKVVRENDSHARISHLYVTCSAPWAHTIERNVFYESDTPFRVTDAILSDLISSAETEIFEQLVANPDVDEKSFSIVERATVDIAVNDYSVHDPLRLRGTSLGLSHIAGLVPEDLLSAITEVQNKLFPDAKLKLHTYMLVMYCVMRDMFPKTDSLCIIDVTGEATEIGVVDHNVLVENMSIPTGSSTFIRSVMESTDRPASDVQTYMEEGDDASPLNPPDLKPHTDAYTMALQNALSTITTHRMVPSVAVITTHRPYNNFFVPLITAALKNALGKDTHILTIENKIGVELSPVIDGDIYLELGARFFHKMHGCGELKQ